MGGAVKLRKYMYFSKQWRAGKWSFTKEDLLLCASALPAREPSAEWTGISPTAGGVVIENNTWYCFGIMGNSEKTISFRASAAKIDELDELAAAQDRPRSYLINEAISNYIELHAYQDALVRQGLTEMRGGRVISHEQVVARLKKSGRASQ